MLESFYQTHEFLVSHVNVPIRRVLMDEINWDDRLIAIKGGRGVGKTDFLLSYAKELLERDPSKARETLYVNFNNFYFAQHTLYEFAGEFVKAGGKTLLLDQTFKYPNWSKELRDCFFHYTNLHIVFIASPVMRLIDGNQDIGHLVKMYNLRGLSFREYLNIKAHANLPIYSLNDILTNHEQIADQICRQIQPLSYFESYLREGYYPYYNQEHNFMDQLLKTMNMMLEIDILLIKQIEVAYLSKIRLLLNMLLDELPCGLNVSKLAKATDTSRATIMNYIKYLKDARLLNLLYAEDREYPMKPARVYLQNPNLCYVSSTRKVDMQSVAETFFYSALHGIHKLNAAENATFIVDKQMKIDVFDKIPQKPGFRYTAIADMERGQGKQVPLWLFGFLY